jgi:thymidine phosphorylase
MSGCTVTPEPVDVIRAKRDGQALDPSTIRSLIAAYTRGDVAEEQMSSLLMAIYFRGLAREELDAWTGAMIDSGRRLHLSGVGRPTVDKHSTGGVGDKISLVLVPLVAHCGAAVPQLSGRGLGHTGGTLDKLESIRGLRTDLAVNEMMAVLADVGCVICGAGPDLAPADRKLYALRDVTGTVESIPLIASSIMSKKIAEGTSALVLDVKVGRGAFMREVGDARRLADTMVGLGPTYGVHTTALLTRMDTPIGCMIGNALEVTEAVDTLRGRGPSDVADLTLALAAEMLDLAGIDADPVSVLNSGAAVSTFEAMVRAQGGDPAAPLPEAAHQETVPAPSTGYVRDLDALAVGVAAWRLGAGRSRKEDTVSASAGVVCLARPGDHVEAGQPVLELRTDEPLRLQPARHALTDAIRIGPELAEPAPLVIEVVRP